MTQSKSVKTNIVGGVCILLPNLNAGGAERVTLTLAQEFVKQGIQLDLVLGTATGDLLADVPDGVRIVDLGTPRLRGMLGAFVRYLRARRPTAVLAVMQEMNCIAVVARKLSGIDCRLVLSEHTHASAHIKALPNRRGRWFMGSAIRYCYPRSDMIVAVSDGVANDLRQNIGLQALSEVIHNPVDVDALTAKAALSIDHPWLSGAQEMPVLISVGNFKLAKDFSTLIKAFALLHGQRHLRLIILGDGAERLQLEKLARNLGVEDDITFPGFVLNPWAWMARANLFVSSSRWEGFPMVLVEALALGLPVVATDCPSGPAEILDSGKYGRLVRTGDPAALAEAITWSLEQPGNRQLLIARARGFAPDKAAERYLAALCG